jgi:3-dehydroquinate synthase
VLVVADDAVVASHAATAIASLAEAGFEVSQISIRAAEVRKCVEVVAQVWNAALEAGLDRNDAIVAVGGGLTGDVAGFAGATWLRGIDIIQVPTTLLAMVDASVGGKTGVNIPLPDAVGGGLGKNLAGAFWPPKLVLADLETLATLPHRELRCGLGECIKHALLGDDTLMGLLQASGRAIANGDLTGAPSLISQAIEVKAEVVAADEREQDRRALLNLGHTFAHAIEGRPALALQHGEAVAIGLVAAGHIGIARGDFDEASLQQLVALLVDLQLPVALPGPAPASELLERMRFDKKTIDGTMRLVVPLTGGGAVLVNDVPDEQVLAAWRCVGAS